MANHAKADDDENLDVEEDWKVAEVVVEGDVVVTEKGVDVREDDIEFCISSGDSLKIGHANQL